VISIKNTIRLVVFLLILATFLTFHVGILNAEDKDINEPLHQGWHIGGAGVIHTFVYDDDDDNDQSPPVGVGGGANFWGGYRGKGRWEIRFNLDMAGVPIERQTAFSTNKSPDFLLGFSVEPILHFRKNPKRWDPYLVLPETGIMHLFRNNSTGVTFVFPGVGLQAHLNDSLSIYIAFKLRWGLMLWPSGEGITIDGEFPIGIAYRF
jgi:hypothetical protein